MAEVLLPNMGTVTKAKVIGGKQDADGNPVGWRNPNPILDMREYKVEFADGAEYLMAEVLLPNMGTVTKAKVIGGKQDADGNPVGWKNPNPILDMREYEVKFADGATDVFTANMIAENLYSQVNLEGNSYSIMSEITDHKSDGFAIKKDDGMGVTSSIQFNSSISLT